MVLVKKSLKQKQSEGEMGYDWAAKTAAATWPGAAEQTWGQGEVLDLHKISGKFPSFPSQCWALSAIDLQVSARKISEADWGGAKGFPSPLGKVWDSGNSAPKRDAGKIYREAAGISTWTTEEPEGGQRRTTDLQGNGMADKRTYPDGSNPHMDFAACDW